MGKLIIIRGNSGSGKSTVAHKLRESLPSKTAIINQDYLRRNILQEKDSIEHTDIIPLVKCTVICCLDLGYDVILEGIFYREKYSNVLKELIAYHTKKSVVFYLDISLEETLKRHKTKPNVHEFGETELRSWYKERDYLDIEHEHILSESLTEQEIVDQIIKTIS